MVALKRVLTFTGYAALGPITGPLVAGVVRNLRKRQPVLASLYVVALIAAWVDLAVLTAWAARQIIR